MTELTKFNYAALSADARVVVTQKTTEIRDRVGRAALNIFEIGERLLAVKDTLGHGQFGAWLATEFGWTVRTSQNMMNVARVFKNETVSHLDIGTKALYLLASDAAPDEVREEVLERAQAGEVITHAEVKAAIEASKPAPVVVVGEPAVFRAKTIQCPECLAIRPDDKGPCPYPSCGAAYPFDADESETAPLNIDVIAPPTIVLPDDGCTVEDLNALIADGKKFGTIYADPPWKYGNQATRASTDNHYPTMTVEDIAALPIQQLAADDAHLHLWVTNGFLFESKAILDAWGFEFRSTFVWCKPQMGIGNYWRNSHEILLTAIRGDAKRFNDHSMKSWAVYDRAAHSAKPHDVQRLIERAGVGPRLELFGRVPAAGWTVWGNQITRNLFEQGAVEVA